MSLFNDPFLKIDLSSSDALKLVVYVHTYGSEIVHVHAKSWAHIH